MLWEQEPTNFQILTNVSITRKKQGVHFLFFISIYRTEKENKRKQTKIIVARVVITSRRGTLGC